MVFKKVSLIVSLCIIFCCAIVSINCSNDTSGNRTILKAIDLQGHRGARGLKPENTIPAFISAITNNMTTIELDTNLTKDKHFIIYHDTEMNGSICLNDEGTPAKAIPVKSLTLKELKTYDCGAIQNKNFPNQQPVENTRLITLKEFFKFIQQYEQANTLNRILNFNIEIKVEDEITIEEIRERARLMVDLLVASGMTKRATIQSFNMEVLREVRKINRNIQISALFTLTHKRGIYMIAGLDSNRNEIIKKALSVKADIISPYHLYVTPEFVKRCHDRNLAVIPWTVNKKEVMEKLLNAGVDGIISDYPNILYQTYIEWKK